MPALAAPARPDVGAPSRRPGSVRRTSTIDTTWPEGFGKPMVLRGRARDIVTTSENAAPTQVAQDDIRIVASAARAVVEIHANRCEEALQHLVGVRAGGGFRSELARCLPQEEIAGRTPLNLLLDDFAGASLVAPWAWSRWWPDWASLMSASSTQQQRPSMAGTCAGYAPDSWALRMSEAGVMAEQNSVLVSPLPRGDDPGGWHALDGHGQTIAHMRRARRIDIWVEGGSVNIDAHFQDSSSEPDSDYRRAVHEYRITATADLESLQLTSITADPRVLPYGECPAAAPNATLLVGAPLANLRGQVPRTLAGTVGCTHLNDTLRSFSDIPALLEYLSKEGY